MQLKGLKKLSLKKAITTSRPNGTNMTAFELIAEYNYKSQELMDEVSASMYGANLNKMTRISTPIRKLEQLLRPKVNSKEDNISKYFVFIDETKYKIVSVKNNWIDIEST